MLTAQPGRLALYPDNLYINVQQLSSIAISGISVVGSCRNIAVTLTRGSVYAPFHEMDTYFCSGCTGCAFCSSGNSREKQYPAHNTIQLWISVWNREAYQLSE